MGAKAESMGVDVFPGFAASHLLYDGEVRLFNLYACLFMCVCVCVFVPWLCCVTCCMRVKRCVCLHFMRHFEPNVLSLIIIFE